MRYSLLLFSSTLLLTLSGAGPARAGWTTLPGQSSPPTARHECSYVGLGDRMYLMGGRGPKPTEAYDPATDSWSTLTPAPIELHHFQALSYAGLIYVVGAMTGPYPGEDPVPNVLVYDPALDTWYEGTTVPPARQRGEAGAVLVGDVIYVAGGQLDGHVSGTVGWIDVYDPRTGAWTALAQDMPHPRDHFHLAQLGDSLYAVGGRVTTQEDGVFNGTIPEVDVFDLLSETWSTLPAALPTQRAGTTIAVLEGRVLLIGGESGAQTVAHDETEAWNPALAMWESLDMLNTGRHGTQAVRYGDQLYVVGGSGNRGGSPELTSQECYREGGDCATPAPVATSTLVADVSAIDFGMVGVGFSADSVVTLVHDGMAGDPDLELLDAFAIGRDQHVFSVAFDDTVLSPGDSTRVTIAFAPDSIRTFGEGDPAYGSLSAAALCVHYAGGRAALTLPLLGEGIFVLDVEPGEAPSNGRPGLSLAVAPNPSRRAVSVSIHLDAPGDLRVSIHGADGRLVSALHDGTIAAGPHRFRWERAANVPPGVYFLRAGTASQRVVRKLVLVD